MSHTVLLTLGRLPKGLDIARSFHASGWRVLIAEPFSWHLSALSRSVARSFAVPSPNAEPVAYRKAIVRLVERENVRLVVPVSEETMHVAALKDALPDGVELFTARQDAVLALHDKLRFAHWLDEQGIAAPRTQALATPESDELAASRRTIVKDRFGASGSHVAYIDRGAALPKRLAAIVQECLEGEEISSFSIVHNGKASVTVLYRSVLRDGTVATVFERVDAPDVAAYVERIAQASGHTGFLSFDMMVTPTGPVAFECNPRANSGIHFLEADDIAPAILDPAFTPRFSAHNRMQQAYPTLTLLWGAIGNWPRYRQIGKALFSARDVTWRLSDPLPFILMTPATWPLLRQSLFEGRSLGEAAIHDIGWFGPADDMNPSM